MSVNLAKPALDLGVVTNNGDAVLAFYRDLLGFPEVGEVPIAGQGVLKKLQCGDSILKILLLERDIEHHVRGGGYTVATGYRYCCITVSNLEEIVKQCRAAGITIAVDTVSPRPGLKAAMIEDPDGNTVELMELTPV